jgi:hypothetical protein
MIRCAWCSGCRMWFGPQTTYESTSTLADVYIGWIMIIWSSSEDQNSPLGNPFQVWQMQLPLPEKWEMIRCAWCDGCRTWFGPQTTNESTSTLADEYIGWIMIFWPSSKDQNSPRGDPFQVWPMQLPLLASEIRLDRMQFASSYDSRVKLNVYGSSQITSGKAGSNSGTLKPPDQHFLFQNSSTEPSTMSYNRKS